MQTKPLAIVAVAINTLLTAVGQVLYKMGAEQFVFSAVGLLTNFPLIFGLLIYAVAAVVLIIALRYGELSVLYPVIALSFVWVNLFSLHLLGESLSSFKWVGICFIILGVSCIGFGSKNGSEQKVSA